MRSAASWVLLVLAGVLAPLAVGATWARAALVDGAAYSAAVAGLPGQEAFDRAAARWLTDAALSGADAAALEAAGQLEQLVGPDAAALTDDQLRERLRPKVAPVMSAFVASPKFAPAWRAVVADGQEGLAAAVRGDQAARDVRVDVEPLWTQAAAGLEAAGLGALAGGTVPAVVRDGYRVVDAASLEGLRTLSSLAGTASLVLAVLAVAGFAGAVAVAGRRTVALAAVGAALLVDAALLALTAAVVGSRVTDAIPVAADRSLGAVMVDAVGASLRPWIEAMTVLGALLVMVAALVGLVAQNTGGYSTADADSRSIRAT